MEDVVQVLLPGDDVTVYEEIAAPPLEAEARQETVAEALPDAPVTLSGADGTFARVTDAEALELAEVPAAFVAVTVNV